MSFPFQSSQAGDRYALTEMLGWEAQMQAQVVGKLVEGLQEKEAQKTLGSVL